MTMRWLALALSVCVVTVFVVGTQRGFAARDRTSVQVRLNQVGYFPDDEKVALVATNIDLADRGASAALLHYPSGAPSSVPSLPLGRSRGRYGKYLRHYPIDFSALDETGTYFVRVVDADGATVADSPPTRIAPLPFAGLLPGVLRFFAVQRCGDTQPRLHDACHRSDGIAVGGPRDGEPVDLSGGWHDAGDYIKFAATTSFVTAVQLFALRELAPAALDPELREAVRAEARQGVEWLLRAYPEPGVFYFQVADGRDHDASWQLPEADTTYPGGRPAYFGLGANLAGRTAAALALCAAEWQADDPDMARRCADAAANLYSDGHAIVSGGQPGRKRQPVVTCVETPAEYESDTLNCGFYSENSWTDDMAFGAVELYALTGTPAYLADAVAYARAAGPAYQSLGRGAVNDLALFELHGHVAIAGDFGKSEVMAALKADFERIRARSFADVYGFAEKSYLWGSTQTACGDALTGLLYGKLTGDPEARAVARRQLDFVLGRNPFGVSFLGGAGSLSPHSPHHRVATLRPDAWLSQQDPVGALVGGPARRSQYPAYLRRQFRFLDAGGPFSLVQSRRFEYHDKTEDYVSNEPAIDYSATLVALLLAFAA